MTPAGFALPLTIHHHDPRVQAWKRAFQRRWLFGVRGFDPSAMGRRPSRSAIDKVPRFSWLEP
jgi:hypothetical protein